MADEAPNSIRLAPGVSVAEADVRWQFSRSSGPGGQNVNKLNTAAELWVAIDALAGMTVPAKARLRRLAGAQLTQDDHVHLRDESTRSQAGNKEAALERLRELVRRALVVPKPRRKTKPSRAAKRRRLDAKKRVGEKKALRGRVGRDP
ncbi:MAG: alternative ribosome rescue aminoacyl-tRNA hydrolase ArfB [Planctomycetota bacterium]